MTAPIPLVDLGAQYRAIKEEIGAAIAGVLESSSFILGREVGAFEEEFARFCGAGHCVGVASGTAALHLALKAVGVGPGDEVITTPFTFIATAEAVLHCGARPVFVDIDPRNFNLDPERLEAAVSEKTRAILPVHLYGQPAEMQAIRDVAQRFGLRVIEDAAQAHGGRYQGAPVGTLGDAACFSFYPAKNLGAYGDAGAVVTNDADLARRVRSLRDHGREDKYTHAEPGFGERLDALQAAVLGVKLGHLDTWIAQRREAAGIYSDLLVGIARITPPWVRPESDHAFHLYVVRAEERDKVGSRLTKQGVGCGIHYPIPLHLQPALGYLGYQPGDFPEAERAAAEVLSLPLYPEITRGQIETVVEAVREAV